MAAHCVSPRGGTSATATMEGPILGAFPKHGDSGFGVKAPWPPWASCLRSAPARSHPLVSKGMGTPYPQVGILLAPASEQFRGMHSKAHIPCGARTHDLWLIGPSL